MGAANSTWERWPKAYEELACSSELAEGIHAHQVICLTTMNIILCITAFVGNTLILVALQKESSLHPSSKLLFRTLAITDLSVGIIVHPLVVSYVASVMSERWNICHYLFVAIAAASSTLVLMSMFTLTAISVDRLLAVRLGLRYRQIVTLKRTYVIVTIFCIVSVTAAAMYFWNNVTTFFCKYAVLCLFLLISILCYGKIFLTLREHHNQIRIQGQEGGTSPLNVARYRKSVSITLWVQLSFALCYLPYLIFWTLITDMEPSLSLYLGAIATLTLVYLNSSLNPILYCWKIREVRRAVKETIQTLLCSAIVL